MNDYTLYIMNDNQKDQNNLSVVVGLGKTGLSCLRFLKMQGRQHVAVTDSRENPPGLDEFKAHYSNVQASFGEFDAKLCLQAQELIINPGISLREPVIAAALKQGIPAIGDIELFARAANAPIIAITGSNGKSTVTTLVGEMAKAAGLNVRVGGNLGLPALDLLDGTTVDLYVVELSSFQLETTYSLRSKVAVILNLSEDHMDRYDSMNDYLIAKQRIYKDCETAVVNRDETAIWESLNLNLSSCVSFGLDEPTAGHFGLRQFDGKTFLAQGSNNLLDTAKLKIKGRHQQANALAALALGSVAGIPIAAMLEALQQFEGLSHRCQWIASQDGVDWFNDSKATNVGATLATLEGLGQDISGKLIVIAGGIGKNADFSPLYAPVKKYVRQLILIGKDAAQIAEVLADATAIDYADSMQQAIAKAKQTAKTGDAVVLAPACASFDMFNNFEHRGEVFMAAVKAMYETQKA